MPRRVRSPLREDMSAPKQNDVTLSDVRRSARVSDIRDVAARAIDLPQIWCPSS
jgi:hypothetical protein